MLEAENVNVAYGPTRVLHDLSLRVDAGQLVGLIGPNGAGKTTFVDAVTGFAPCDGTLRLNGEDLGRMAPDRRARLGLSRTWQSTELFADLDVEDNLRIAIEAARGRRRRRSAAGAVVDALRTVGLEDSRSRFPHELSHGDAKLVGLARALVGRPSAVLLDEPAAGLDPSETAELGAVLRRVTDEGVAALLIDHDVPLVASVCDRLYVLDFGQLIATGAPDEVLARPEVAAAYLGAESASGGDHGSGDSASSATEGAPR